jgi:AraC family transcriptional activator of pobA
MIGLSTKTLNTITKNIVNKSAKEFIDEIYTKQIKRLLIHSDGAIKEIAYASGFEETTNFYKYFKRQTQLTPEQFRNSF